MKRFFSTFGAALLAFIVGVLLLWLVMGAVVAGVMGTFAPRVAAVSENSVLVIDFAKGIVDSPENAFSTDLMNGRLETSNTLLEVVDAIRCAATDDNIKGIYIHRIGYGGINTANTEELRAELQRFKDSGKFIVAYNDTYTQGLYWLSSVADKVYLNPEGALEWHGLAGSVYFYKGLLDKLGVDVQVIRHGTFKSAVEPYISNEMSPANRLQMTTLVESMWQVLLDDISASRGIPVERLREYAEQLAVATPADAVRLEMVDGLRYADEVAAELNALAGVDEANMVTLGSYISGLVDRKISRNKIAVIYADGQIVDGDSSNGSVGDLTLTGQIAEARRDDGVKAVVLRVNSPGGSALASENIWREMELCRAVKPVIISMGGMAASGGYYISSPADVVFADRTTTTGSIGVFGMIPNAGRALKDKLGVTVDVVKTSPSADIGTWTRALTSTEMTYLQNNVERCYSTFVGHVAAGRNMTFEQVDSIGQGRVWLGTDAERIGLVDGFGGLTNAIGLAADRAGVADDYRVTEIYQTNSLSMILGLLSGAGVKASGSVEVPNGGLKYIDGIMRTAEKSGVMAMMPYELTVK